MPLFILSTLPFIGTTFILFHSVILGQATLIGNADRLNHMLAFARFHAVQIRAGNFAFWDDLMFGGLDAAALNFDPLAFLYALAPPRFFMATTAASVIIQLSLAGVLMHAALRAFGMGRPAAVCAAICYQCSALAILQVTQHDFTFLVLMLSPGAWLAVRSLAPTRRLKPFLGLIGVFVPVAAFGFLQNAIYVMAFTGLYALWRSVRLRHVGPLATTALAEAVAVLAAGPRILAVLSEKAVLVRSAPPNGFGFSSIFEFQNIRAWEVLRLIADGIFGRFPSEAVQLGNNINLTEGMLLGSTAAIAVLALVAVLMLAFPHRHRNFLLNADVPAMAVFTVCGILVIAAWPVNWLLYALFLKSDLVHARILVAVAFPFTLLAAAALDTLLAPSVSPPSGHSGTKAIVAACALGAAAGLIIPVASPWMAPDTIFSRLAVNGRQLGPPLPEPTARPTRLTAHRVAPDTVDLSWTFEGNAAGFSINLDAGTSSWNVGFIPPPGHTARIGTLSPQNGYRFSVRACNTTKCFNGLSVWVPPYAPGGPDRFSSDGEPPLTQPIAHTLPRDHMLTLQPSVTLASMLIGGGTLFLIGFVMLSRSGRALRLPLVAGLIGLATSNALFIAEGSLNGPHLLWTGERPAFNRGNSMLAPPGDFVPPDARTLAEVKKRLDNGNFRAVALCDPTLFHTFCAPHMAHFWNLRLLGGYGPGVPSGLAAFPWPDGIRSMRAMTFTPPPEALPWTLLGLNNVRYAVLVTPGIYRNRLNAAGGARPAGVEDFTVYENPRPVTPRVFLAAAAKPAADIKTAVAALLSSSNPNPVTLSHIVGLTAPARFDATGGAAYTFDAGTVRIRLSPSPERRLLILNEAWHPGWTAETTSGPLTVLPANGTMRAVILPPGTTQVIMRYRPIYRTHLALFALLTAAAILASCRILWKMDRAHVTP